MGRGVEVRSDALVTVYADWEPEYDYWRGWQIEMFEDTGQEWDEDDVSEQAFYDDYWYHQSEWDNMVEWFTERVKELWPSFTDTDRWWNRETHIVLENELVEVGIANYSGMTALTIAPKDHGDYWEVEARNKGLAARWAQQIESRFEEEFGTYAKLGTFSNGESVYQVKESVNG